jgi:hypothetical protein
MSIADYVGVFNTSKAAKMGEFMPLAAIFTTIEGGSPTKNG